MRTEMCLINLTIVIFTYSKFRRKGLQCISLYILTRVTWSGVSLISRVPKMVTITAQALS